MTRKMKDSGVEWIGEIPEEWGISRLKSICIIKDGTHDTPQYVDYSDNVYPLITSKNINNGKIGFEDVKYISEEDYIEINKRSDVQLYDVIMPMIGTVGNPAIVESENKFSIKNVALFKCNKDVYLSKLIYYILQSSMITEQFEFLNRGGVQAFVSLNQLKNLICIAIPKDEINSLVNYLDNKCTKIDHTIEKEKEVIEKLKEYKQSVITEAVTKGLNPDVKMKDSGVEWIGEIPEHWRICRLKNYASICNGQDYKEILDENGIYPVMGSGGAFAKANDFIYNKPSVLLGRKGTIDKPLYVDYPFWTVDTMYYTIISEKNYVKFFYYLCKTINFEYYQYGSAVPSMTQRDLNNIIFANPKLEEQKEIADYLDKKCSAIDKLISKKEKVIDKLTEYKKSLIYECVTGKREIK